MLKKTVTYTDYNDVERTEDFYFNLTKAEVVEMQLTTKGGLAEMIEKITKAKDMPALVALFKDLVMRAYGVKSADGKQFIKNDDVRAEFAQCEAYSEIFMELATDDEKAADFVNGILPKDYVNAAAMKSIAPSAM